MTATIRTATPADAAAVAAFFAAAFTDTFGHLYPPHDLAAFLATTDECAFASELSDGQHRIWLAEGAGISGFIKTGPPSLPFEPRPGRPIELRQLYVAPAEKGTGLARELADLALADARARGFTDIYLSVFTDNHRARRFYARLGFREIGPYAFRVGDTIDEDIVCHRAL